MRDILFIGDEVTAAGFHMAGVDTLVPGAGEGARAVAEALPERRVILLTTELGQELPNAMVEKLLHSVDPVVVFLPDLRGHDGPLDLEGRVRRALGIEEL